MKNLTLEDCETRLKACEDMWTKETTRSTNGVYANLLRERDSCVGERIVHSGREDPKQLLIDGTDP